MTIFPTLPGCGQPATIRIELYADPDTPTPAMAGSVYVCDDHQRPALDAIAAAGFTPKTMPSDGDAKRCGDGLDFSGPGARKLTPPDGDPTPEQTAPVAAAPVEFPDLPGCGDSATIRVEIYSPANGFLHGSLDGQVYACSEHVGLFISILHSVGLVPYRVPGSFVIDRVCGYLYRFPTASAPEPPILTHQIPVPDIEPVAVPLVGPVKPVHPPWCDRAFCPDRSGHRSHRFAINPDGGEPVGVRLWLWQALQPDDAAPLLVLAATEADGTRELFLELGQARAMAHRCRMLLRSAGVL